MTSQLFYYTMVFVAFLGLSVGSFLNVVIYRLPEGLSLSKPASRCGACEHPIRFYDNIPVLSWFILRGKCRDCKAKISPRYPLIELVTGALAVFIWWQLPILVSKVDLPPEAFTLETFGAIFLLRFTFVSLMIAISFIDLDHFIIPHRLTIIGMILGLASPWLLQYLLGDPNYLAMWPPMMPIMSIVSLVLGGALIMLIFYAYLALRGVVALGGGDATLMAVVGAWLGIPGIIFVCFAASVQGIIAAALTSLLGLNFVADSKDILGEDYIEPSPKTSVTKEDNLEQTEPIADLQSLAQNANLNENPMTHLDADTTKGGETLGEHGDEIVELDEDSSRPPITRAAIPFGPFIALAALEFLLLGVWFPEYLSMVRTYFIFF